MAALFSLKDWKALHGILCFAALAAATFVPIFRTWPLLWLAPLAVYFALVALLPPLRRSFSRWDFGRVSRPALLATAAITVLSCTALYLFQKWSQPDLRAYAAALPILPGLEILAGGFVFSVLNAGLEELIFRGIFFTAIEAQAGRWMAVVGTAAIFGYGHMHGYPPGPLGAGLAGLYGLALGWLRVYTGGLGLPVLAHIAADATIFTIVMNSAR
jgi:membrane protease YdiL (CAAX protease family)